MKKSRIPTLLLALIGACVLAIGLLKLGGAS